MIKRVGILAGTFDPVHDGHLEIARSSIKYLDLDLLNFMIEKDPWSSKVPIQIDHRINMLDLAIKNENKIKQLIMNDSRFDIKKTLKFLENKYLNQELYLIFGADVFLNMNQENWPYLKELFKHYIVIFERSGVTEDEISNHAKELGIAVAILPSAHNQHRSTDVRFRPHEAKIWVSEEVAEYIELNDLYKLSDSVSL